MINELQILVEVEKALKKIKQNRGFDKIFVDKFDELQKRGNRWLDLVESQCECCERHQYFFVGNNDGSYLHLQFKIENEIVLDINECGLLKCLVPSHINIEKQVFLNTELPQF